MTHLVGVTFPTCSSASAMHRRFDCPGWLRSWCARHSVPCKDVSVLQLTLYDATGQRLQRDVLSPRVMRGPQGRLFDMYHHSRLRIITGAKQSAKRRDLHENDPAPPAPRAAPPEMDFCWCFRFTRSRRRMHHILPFTRGTTGWYAVNVEPRSAKPPRPRGGGATRPAQFCPWVLKDVKDAVSHLRASA